jgi:uncharacterized protein
MPFRHFPRDRFASMPWKNGGGLTREIFRFPEHAADWQWRISIADVAADGPFSAFPGCDRALLLLSGAGMRLQFLDRIETLQTAYDTLRFAGEDPVEAFLLDGPTSDFNAIWRRDTVAITLERRAMTGSLWCIAEPGVSWFVYFLSGRGRIKSDSDSPAIEAGDGLWLSPRRDEPRLVLEAHGEALWLKVTALQRSSRV